MFAIETISTGCRTGTVGIGQVVTSKAEGCSEGTASTFALRCHSLPLAHDVREEIRGLDPRGLRRLSNQTPFRPVTPLRPPGAYDPQQLDPASNMLWAEPTATPSAFQSSVSVWTQQLEPLARIVPLVIKHPSHPSLALT